MSKIAALFLLVLVITACVVGTSSYPWNAFDKLEEEDVSDRSADTYELLKRVLETRSSGCDYKGANYKLGEEFKDVCNTCVCTFMREIACTHHDCH